MTDNWKLVSISKEKPNTILKVSIIVKCCICGDETKIIDHRDIGICDNCKRKEIKIT